MGIYPENSVIIRTTNGGQNWSTQPNGSSYPLTGVSYIDSNIATVVGDGGVILRTNNANVPVELITYFAILVGNRVQLIWQTATETNNLGFEIERKGNVQTWNTIGFVPGNGTTTEIQNYSFTDKQIGSSGKYCYRLKQIDYDGSFEYSNEIFIDVELTLTEFELEQNYPNPFNPSTKIRYSIPSVTLRHAQSDISVSLKVYDILGNEIETLVNEEKSPGTYEVTWNADGLPSGVYFYQLRAGSFIETRKMLLLR